MVFGTRKVLPSFKMSPYLYWGRTYYRVKLQRTLECNWTLTYRITTALSNLFRHASLLSGRLTSSNMHSTEGPFIVHEYLSV